MATEVKPLQDRVEQLEAENEELNKKILKLVSELTTANARIAELEWP